MDFLHLKASENLKISDEISNMKFDIIVRPFLCSVPLQKVFRFKICKVTGHPEPVERLRHFRMKIATKC